MRRALPLAVPCLTFLVFASWFSVDEPARFSFPLDDAWIHRVYARSFVEGRGLQYNAGVQEAGSTSPMWAIVSSPAHLLAVFGTGAVVFAVKLLGVCLALIAVGAVLGSARALAGRQSSGAAGSVLAAVLFALVDGYYWTRWLDPPALVLTATACVGLGMLVDGTLWVLLAPSHAIKPVVVRLAGGVVVLVLCLFLPFLVGSALNRRAHLASDGRAVDRVNVQTGRWIAAHIPGGATVGVNDAGATRYFGGRRTIDLMGLNSHEVAFSDAGLSNGIRRADWLAVFPGWFRGGALASMEAGFTLRRRIRIAPEEYTVCNCPEQTEVWVMRATSASRPVD